MYMALLLRTGVTELVISFAIIRNQCSVIELIYIKVLETNPINTQVLCSFIIELDVLKVLW